MAEWPALYRFRYPEAVRLKQLRDMLAIARRGSLSAAARELGVAQPALTRSIRELERELGVPLFAREARGMVLTPAGRLFLRRASSALSELRRAREEIEQSQGGAEGSVVAGLSIMPHISMLPGALRPFQRRFPKVNLEIIEGLYPSIEAGLLDGSVDLYLGASPPAAIAAGLKVETLFHNTRTVFCRKGHPLMQATSLRDLAASEWITPTIGHDAEEDLRRLFASVDLPPPRITIQAHSALTVIVALANSDLLAMLPSQWEEFPLTRGALQAIPIREYLPAPSIVLIRRPDLPLTPAADFLCDLLRRHPPKGIRPVTPADAGDGRSRRPRSRGSA
jgi:DNA-binding transcriptional LysR family regulator